MPVLRSTPLLFRRRLSARLGHLGVMLRAYGNLPRPEPWLPYVFTSIVLRPHAVQLQGWLLIEVRKWGC
jgi:hypothetical protein